jgi:signal transduction histidine kinase/ActR/RegA family two-component response regulator
VWQQYGTASTVSERMDETATHRGTIGLLRLLAAVAAAAWLLGGVAGGWLAWHSASPWGPVTVLALALIELAGLAPLLLAVAAVRRAGQDRLALAGLHAEVQRREAAEHALRQLQKMDAIGRLTRGIAHDFNNHLTAISSNVELLARRLPPDAEGLSRLADAAMQGVRRAAALTHRLLAFARQQPPDPEPLDLGRLVGSMTELLRRTLGEGITVRTLVPNGLWLTWADASQLEAALLHLAVNARENMPEGGLLTLEASNIQPGSDPDDPDLASGHYVMLAVTDSGETSGAGAEPLLPGEAGRLGLSLVYGVARQFHGLVRVKRPPEGGNAVQLYLPRFLPAPVADAPDLRAEGGGETILVVEDEDSVRQASAAALREMGYIVLEAPDAMEGFRLIADRGGVDLLFTDLGLPGGVDGRALADAARNLRPELKVLFTTGYRQNAAQGETGAAALLLPKPFTLEQLAAKVREALGEAQAPVMATPAHAAQ